jgi:hypothetical protein
MKLRRAAVSASLSLSAHMRDLLVCAKHLFIAASHAGQYLRAEEIRASSSPAGSRAVPRENCHFAPTSCSLLPMWQFCPGRAATRTEFRYQSLYENVVS